MSAEDRWDVLLTGPIDDAGREAIADVAEFTSVDEYDDRAALAADIDRFDAIIHRPFDLDADLLARATNLRVIAKHGVGVDSVDVEAATREGIVVCNTPGANARAVAEHSLALLLAVRKRLRPADADLRAGEWPADDDEYIAGELGGRTLGLFGFGDIARRLAGMATGVGMEVVAYDPYVDAADYPAEVRKVDEEGLYDAADLLSVHAPLTDETRGAIGAAELAALPAEGIVVTAARGGIVVEDALVDALAAGDLAGAGVDVFETEPPADDHPLFAFENVVVTPHIAGTSREAIRAKATRAAANVRTVLEGGVPDSTLNPAAVE